MSVTFEVSKELKSKNFNFAQFANILFILFDEGVLKLLKSKYSKEEQP
jgi:hypothetical protein